MSPSTSVVAVSARFSFFLVGKALFVIKEGMSVESWKMFVSSRGGSALASAIGPSTLGALQYLRFLVLGMICLKKRWHSLENLMLRQYLLPSNPVLRPTSIKRWTAANGLLVVVDPGV